MKRFVIPNYFSVIDCRLDKRYNVRLVGRARSIFQKYPKEEKSVLMTNISFGGFHTEKSKLALGHRFVVEMPVLGDRLAQVRWVEGRSAGWRFSEPLTRDELHKITRRSENEQADREAAGGAER